MPDKVTQAAIRLWWELVKTLAQGAIVIAVVLTIAEYAFGPTGWIAQLIGGIL